MAATLIETAMEWGVNRAALAVLMATTIMLPACGTQPSYAEEPTEEAYSEESFEGEDSSLREEAAIETAVEDFGDETYQDIGDTSLCTEDCSGHDAGFEWAKENDITDPYDCGGKSQSFIEGCEAYAEAIQEQADEYEAETEY